MRHVSVALGLLLAGVSSFQPVGCVGFRTMNVTYWTPMGTPRTMPVALWYPSAGLLSTYDYPYLSGQVVLHGDIVAGRWPVVVLSHGVFECGVAAAYIAHALAAAGYIVAAPDHRDSANCHIGGGTSPPRAIDWTKPHLENFPDRPSDIRAVIDTLRHQAWMPQSPFYGAVGPFAGAGHSLGGWTIGAVDGGHKSEADWRLFTAILWSPSANLEPAFYQALRPPLLYQFGEFEPDKWWPYAVSSSPRYLDIIPGADHYAFTDKDCVMYGTVENCLTFNDRGREIVVKTIATLNYYLRGEIAALQVVRAVEHFVE